MRYATILMTLAVILAIPKAASAQEPERLDKPTGVEEIQVDPDVEFWVLILARRINDENETIRNSAHRALVAVGKPALPTLRNVAQRWDEATAEQAKKIMGRIEKGQRRGPRAQGSDRPGLGKGAAERLGLQGDVKERFEEITKAHFKKIRDLLQKVRDGELAREAAAQAREALRKALEADLSQILTPEQMEKLDRFRDRVGPRRGAEFRRRRVARHLDLTEVQKTQFDAIAKSHREEVRKVMRQMGSGDLDRETGRATLDALREAFKNEVRQILTPEQFEKFEKAHDRRGTDRAGRGDHLRRGGPRGRGRGAGRRGGRQF